jgi:hypothetical protein
MICWTIAVSAFIYRPLAQLYPSDDEYKLEEFPARGLLRLWRRISPKKQFWNEAAIRVRLRADMMQFSPLEFFGSRWDAATHSCSTSVGWHYHSFRDTLGGDGHPCTRDILGAACSGPRCGRTVCTFVRSAWVLYVSFFITTLWRSVWVKIWCDFQQRVRVTRNRSRDTVVTEAQGEGSLIVICFAVMTWPNS